MKVALGGRTAEELVFTEISTGAESDIDQLTELARQMVGRWGMSDAIGPIAVVSNDGRGPFGSGAEVSEHTQQLVDDEVRRIVEEASVEVHKLLEANRGKLDSLAEALLEHETLDEADAYAAAGLPRNQEAAAEPPLALPAGRTNSTPEDGNLA